jgi:hypothetical protein
MGYGGTKILEKKWECSGRERQLFIDFEKAYDLGEVLYSILNEFNVPVKLVRLIKTCLHETYSDVPASKNLFDAK